RSIGSGGAGHTRPAGWPDCAAAEDEGGTGEGADDVPQPAARTTVAAAIAMRIGSLLERIAAAYDAGKRPRVEDPGASKMVGGPEPTRVRGDEPTRSPRVRATRRQRRAAARRGAGGP